MRVDFPLYGGDVGFIQGTKNYDTTAIRDAVTWFLNHPDVQTKLSITASEVKSIEWGKFPYHELIRNNNYEISIFFELTGPTVCDPVCKGSFVIFSKNKVYLFCRSTGWSTERLSLLVRQAIQGRKY